MKHLRLIWALLALALVGAEAPGEEHRRTSATDDTLVEATEDSSRYVVSMPHLTVTDMRINDTLLIMLNAFGKGMAGFELKFAIESRFIDIDTILPGEICDSCGWEYFNARPVGTYGKQGYPPVVWQTVSLADVMPDVRRPSCYGLDREASILKLVLTSEHVARVPDTVVPIFFFWEDCSDNTIAGISGDTLAISVKVIDYYDAVFTGGPELFPNRTGTPEQCLNPAARNKPQRWIEFYNGGVEFKMDLPGDTTDTASR